MTGSPATDAANSSTRCATRRAACSAPSCHPTIMRRTPITSISICDRKSVVEGKSVSVRVDLRGLSIIKKIKKQKKLHVEVRQLSQILNIIRVITSKHKQQLHKIK